MNMQFDYVEYENQIFRIHEIMKQLGLSMSTYRKYRMDEKTPQEAFEQCLKNLPDMICYAGKKYPARKKIKELGLGLRTYERKLKAGFTPQEAFDYVLENKQKEPQVAASKLSRYLSIQKRKEDNQKKYESYVKRGLPSSYKSLHEYCDANHLDFRKIWHVMEKNPSLSLQDAVLLQNKMSNYAGNIKYKMYGVSFKSLCLKYGYPYDTCVNYFKKTGSAFLAFLYYEVVRLNIPFKLRKQVRAYLPYFMDMSEDFLAQELQRLGFPTDLFSKLKEMQEIARFLRQEFFYYEIFYFVEVQWTSYCSQSIEAISYLGDIDYQKEKERIQNNFRQEVFQTLNVQEKELEEMYQRYFELMSFEIEDENVWKFKKRVKNSDFVI